MLCIAWHTARWLDSTAFALLLAPGEVLIDVAAAGVNRADVWTRMGRYPIKTNGNPVLGLEVAGTVAACGEGVDGAWRGRRVCTLTDGGYAQYAVAPAGQLLAWPDGFDAVQAAALPEAVFTVWANLFAAGHLAAGETALIHGGRGAVGLTAIQLAKARGARVLATSGSDAGCADCRRVGADAAINYRRDDLVAACRALAPSGVDVILDPIGAANLAANLAVLGMDGRLVVIGFTGGAVAERVDLTPVLARRLVITGSAMRPRGPAEKAALATAITREVWPLLAREDCQPVIARTFPLAHAAEAHRLMEAGGYLGKIVLVA